MKKTAICIFFIIISTTNSWAQNHKVFCDKNEKYLKEEGTITNGKKEDYWKFYECFETVANLVGSEGLYKNDQKVGLWKFYDDVTHRTLAKTVSFVDGLEEGEFTEYYLDGEIKYKGFYVKGKKKGEVKEFYESGKIKEIENFDTGKITYFFENGKVEETGFVKYGEYINERTGEWKENYENGKLKSIGNYSSSNRVGKWQQYHDNGQLSATGIYKDDGFPQPASWTTYDRSGQKDGINIPEPTKSHYKLLCADIGTRTKVNSNEYEYYEYTYEKRILLLACVDVKVDDEETIKKKVQIFWNKYKKNCYCDSVTFGVQNGSILKFALAQNFPQVIETLADYGCDINFIDPADGLNLLDYVSGEIARLKKLQNSANTVMVYERYKDGIIGLGGKSNK